MALSIPLREKQLLQFAERKSPALVKNAYDYLRLRAQADQEPARREHSLKMAHRMIPTGDPVLISVGLIHRYEPKYIPKLSNNTGKQNETLNLLSLYHDLTARFRFEKEIDAKKLKDLRLSAERDPRVLLLLLHDVYDSLGIETVERSKNADQLAKNAFEVFAPIAHAGSWELAAKMHDRAHEILEKEEHENLQNFVTDKEVSRCNALAQRVRFILKKQGVDSTVTCRVKSRLRAAKEARLKHNIKKPTVDILNQLINDKIGIRVILHPQEDMPSREEISKKLIESLQKGRLALEHVETKDYAAEPKKNLIEGQVFLYRGRHERFKGGVEVQIRTEEEHRAAELESPHYKYKEKALRSRFSLKRLSARDWLKRREIKKLQEMSFKLFRQYHEKTGGRKAVPQLTE